MDGRDAVKNEIDTILNAYHSKTLWEMAEAAGLEITTGSKRLGKAALLSKMRAEFFTRERVLASWGRLDKREQAVLNRLLLRGGKTSTRNFEREIIRAGLAVAAEEPRGPNRYYYHGVPYAEGYAGDPGRAGSVVFQDVIARLTYHGLVFSQEAPLTSGNTPYKLQFHPTSTIYVPDVVRRYLPAPVPVDMPELTPARVQVGEPVLLLRDLYLYWDFVRRNEVTLIQAGTVGKRGLKAINEVLLVPDPELEDARHEDKTGRLYLLRLLLEALTLVRGDGTRLYPAGKDALHIPLFWSAPRVEQLRACLEAWPRLNGFQELGDVAAQYGPRYTYARQALLNVLKTLPAGVWFEPVELLERVQGEDIGFLFPERSRVENYRGSYYYSSSGYYYGQIQTLVETFERFEDGFVRTCLAGFLHQLGVVDLGFDSTEPAGQGAGDDGLRAFRLTPAGRAILGIEAAETLAEADEGKLVVQPNFQLMAIGPVKPALLARLDLFAEREQADRGAFQYRLSRETVYRAQQLGMDAASVIRFLREANGVDLPQNVYRSLEEWGESHERIVFRAGVSLLQAANADVLAKLREGISTGRLLARPATPEVTLIKDGREQQLISALVEQGMFPAVSGAQPEAADKSVVVQEDGLVRPVHAVPSLHLRGRLSRLAEEGEGGQWQLTAASVRQAAGNRDKVLRLLDELGKLNRGTLPDRLIVQIKAWGGYYGDAAVEALTLMEFQNQTILDELTQHPGLRGQLIPFSAGERALAVVRSEELAQVKEILANLGVRVADGLDR